MLRTYITMLLCHAGFGGLLIGCMWLSGDLKQFCGILWFLPISAVLGTAVLASQWWIERTEDCERIDKLIKRIHTASLPPTEQPFDPKDN